MPVKAPYLNPMQLAYLDRVRGLAVIASASIELDGKAWLHVSVSHRYQMPTWEQLVEVKETFIGSERQALQVLPKMSEWVNVHPYCLHLWACVEGDGLPDFRQAEPMMGGKLGV